jgi:Flp pilus assembly protein TadD
MALACSMAALAVVGCSWKQLDSKSSANWGRTPDIEPIVEEESGMDIYPRTHLAAGQLLEEQGMLAKAVVQYQKAIAVNHKYVAAHNRLGVVLGKLGRFDEAEIALRKAVALRPDSSFAHNNLGFCYVMQERWTEAAGEFERAIDLNPDLKRAHINLGLAHGKLKRYDDSLLSFAQALPVEQAHYNVGMLFMADGRKAEAADQFRMAVDLDPQFDAAREKLALMDHVAPIQASRHADQPAIVEWEASSQPVVAKASKPVRAKTIRHPVQRDNSEDLVKQTVVRMESKPVEVQEIVTMTPEPVQILETPKTPVHTSARRSTDATVTKTAMGQSDVRSHQSKSTAMEDIPEIEVIYMDAVAAHVSGNAELPVIEHKPVDGSRSAATGGVATSARTVPNQESSSARRESSDTLVITAVPIDEYEKANAPVVSRRPVPPVRVAPVESVVQLKPRVPVARAAAVSGHKTIELIPASQIHEVDSIESFRAKRAKKAVVLEDNRVSASPILPARKSTPVDEIKPMSAMRPGYRPVSTAKSANSISEDVEVIQATELVSTTETRSDRRPKAVKIVNKQPAKKQDTSSNSDVLVVQALPE